MNKILRPASWCLVLLAGTYALAQSEPPKADPPVKEDPVNGLVDPYDATAQRNLFLKAAGVDNELTSEELSASRPKEAQPAALLAGRGERWELMLQFDKNGNKTLDWFEMDAYRREVRKLILEAYDKNNDSHLTGSERDEANKALASGRIPGLERRLDAGSGTPGKSEPSKGGFRDEMMKKYDKDGDGKLSEEERQAARDAFRSRMGQGGQAEPVPPPGEGDKGEKKEGGFERRRREMMEKYDKDGDGKISDEERRAMFENMRRSRQESAFKKFDADGDGKISQAERADLDRQAKTNWEAAAVRWGLRDFDADGDGALSQDEEAAAEDFRRKAGDIGTHFRDRMMDINGDGQISDEERAEAGKQFRDAGIKMLARAGQYMDADGDGQVSSEERQQFDLKVRGGMIGYINDFSMKFDADKDGKLNADERDKLIDGMKASFSERVAKADADGDGRLSTDEFIRMMEDFGKDIGVAPVRKEEKKD